jgi:hypothetical protein
MAADALYDQYPAPRSAGEESISDDAKLMQGERASRGPAQGAHQGQHQQAQNLGSTVHGEEDLDSGISSSVLGGAGRARKRSQQMLEKKSVFTIKYDNVQNQLDLTKTPTT